MNDKLIKNPVVPYRGNAGVWEIRVQEAEETGALLLAFLGSQAWGEELTEVSQGMFRKKKPGIGQKSGGRFILLAPR